MVINLTLNKNNPYIACLVAANLIGDTVPVEINWSDNESFLILPDSKRINCQSHNDILRTLGRLVPNCKLYGNNAMERTQIDHWLTYSLSWENFMDNSMIYLNKAIAPVTFLCTNMLTVADLALYNEMCWHYNALLTKGVLTEHVKRWYQLIHNHPAVQKAWKMLPSDAKHESFIKNKKTIDKEVNKSERKQEGKFIDLPGAVKGKVVVRFPPEASGYLHIGHAKAALLNQYYAQTFEGKLIMRFDDTNPAKETVEFEDVILEDLQLLKIKPDIFTHTSNYFDLMLSYCEKLISENKAYVDDTPPEQMKNEREQKIESKNRFNSVEQNLKMWKNMVDGSEYGGKCCVRAKIDMSSPNGCMRDPTIYRCKNEPHPRTGTKYKVYPTYDFACPIVDAIEGVTHTLRTMEYHDRDDQFYWFIDALKLRKPFIWEYSRLNMTNTVLSKRKLTWFVNEGLVDGWDDPRFPTVRGIIRRGMTVEGLKEFIIAQGSSKSVVFMNWDKIWAFNKKVIDPIAPRYTALEMKNRIVVNVEGAIYESKEVPLHPKNEQIGKKLITLAPCVYIDYEDVVTLKESENATFINWGNLLIKRIHKDSNGLFTSVDAALNLDDKDFKKTQKITWLAVEKNVNAYTPCWCVYFDNIISKAVLGKDEDFKTFIGHKTREEIEMLGDPELKNLKKGDIIQLQRRGFFKVDNAYAGTSPVSGVTSPVILFSIPDGHTKNMPSFGLKINASEVNERVISGNKLKSDNGINDKIPQQGGRELKTKTAENTSLHQSSTNACANELHNKISKHGEKVRQMKADKTEKSLVDAEVAVLLSLKKEYKQLTGQDWKPDVQVETGAPDLLGTIEEQGDKVRQLKAYKAEKSILDAEIKNLLNLKAKYQQLTGHSWNPSLKPLKQESSPDLPNSATVSTLLQKISKQGDKIRELKSSKSEKSIVEPEVKLLLALKTDYKSLTGQEWKPGVCTPNTSVNTKLIDLTHDMDVYNEISVTTTGTTEKDLLNSEIKAQGEKVKYAKTSNASEEDIDEEVKKLLALKAKYKDVTGSDFPVTGRSSGERSKKSSGEKKEHSKCILQLEKISKLPTNDTNQGGLKKQTRLGLEAKKEENLSDWYSQVNPNY